MKAEKKERQDPLIVIASNRGPFTFQEKEDGEFDIQRGSGGLVTALGALAEQQDVVWVAAAMSEDDRRWVQAQGNQDQLVEGIRLKLITPDEDAYQKYYHQISNPLLWFIHHQLWDSPRSPNITAETWDAWNEGYLKINQQMAEAIAEVVAVEERPVIIFPQDYQLYLVPHFLRQELGESVYIQPFIHIPWPSHDAWSILPKPIREKLLRSLLDSDRIGFQTRKDAFNFVQTCRYFLPGVESRGYRDRLFIEEREILASAYPISIDVEQVQAIMQETETKLLKSQLINFVSDRRLILRVDRIEPSKNILRGLKAYRTLLEKHPEHQGEVQMLCLLVPSRMEVEEYQDYMQEIMAEAGLINATYSNSIWEPVRLIVGDNYPRAIAAMQMYSVLLVNPIRDGMNLVAKEGALVNQNDGVLILSEQTGAFEEMGEHVLAVSPFDIYGTAEAIHQGLTMPVEERQNRAEALRETVVSADVKRWFYDQVDDALTD
ncbi:MAG: trehalose-6-phosphate synthase [Anaerolineales bacterium]|nr:trehalose-6-phosphate synthase [Anaerolineales bacterium]